MCCHQIGLLVFFYLTPPSADEVEQVRTHDQYEHQDEGQRYYPAKQSQEHDPPEDQEDRRDDARLVGFVPRPLRVSVKCLPTAGAIGSIWNQECS